MIPETNWKNYEHLLTMGDFDTDISEPTMASFCTHSKLKNLVSRTNLLQESK